MGYRTANTVYRLFTAKLIWTRNKWEEPIPGFPGNEFRFRAATIQRGTYFLHTQRHWWWLPAL
jgi:hypothetical protein